GKIMRLYGDAEVTKGAMHLAAAYIEIDFRKSELFARAVYDSATKQYVGVPVFKDATQEFSALSMRYNFRTGKGVTEAAETRFDEGFYFGKKIKRVDENTLFIQDGIYTTCDAPHPHYFFRSDRMKVVVNDKIYVDQPTLHVADVPIFFIPIGVFFARSGGKQSGLIIPTWSQTSTRGFGIEGLGYFWAGNDYIDAKFTTNLYSKGGYTFNTVARGRVRGAIELADLDYTFGQTRDDPDKELETSHHVRYVHAQKIGRRSQLGGVLDFSTLNAIRQVASLGEQQASYDDFTRQLLISNLSYNTGFDWGSFSAQYDRTQNIVTNELTQRVPLTFSVPTWTPFARGGAEPGVFDNLSLSYTGRGTWEEVRQDTLVGGGFRVDDTRRGIQHSPSINLTLPRIGYFNITPSLQFQGSTFFRRTSKSYINDSTVVTSTTPNFRQTFTYSASVGMTTTIYGIVQPRILGLNALRHVIQPTISFRYRPDFGEPQYDYFDSVLNPRSLRYEKYSVFESDASVAPTPSSGLENSISLNLQNTFEAKIAQGDTVDDKRVRLLTLNAGASYNAASTTFKWSEISLNA
ncbi:MAG: LPS-assembly protein LptD, partial [bacterium]|nr:LPS-assembly protein LptD [Candidatus Kapabacteria bacterium]